jgi:hypothetical protein
VGTDVIILGDILAACPMRPSSNPAAGGGHSAARSAIDRKIRSDLKQCSFLDQDNIGEQDFKGLKGRSQG